jgi:hypothetical protein
MRSWSEKRTSFLSISSSRLAEDDDDDDGDEVWEDAKSDLGSTDSEDGFETLATGVERASASKLLISRIVTQP